MTNFAAWHSQAWGLCKRQPIRTRCRECKGLGLKPQRPTVALFFGLKRLWLDCLACGGTGWK